MPFFKGVSNQAEKQPCGFQGVLNLSARAHDLASPSSPVQNRETLPAEPFFLVLMGPPEQSAVHSEAPCPRRG